MRLFLAGDVMLGRAIDRLLPVLSDGRLLNGTRSSPDAQVQRLESKYGPISVPLDARSVWADALAEIGARKPDLGLVNLETAVTTSDDIQEKSLNFRMHPGNLPFLQALGIDFCALANNHTLDWGRDGLIETRRVLHEAGIATAGGGANLAEAQAPAVMPRPGGGRVLVFSLTSFGAGSRPGWQATETEAGQWLLPAFGEPEIEAVQEVIRRHRQAGDFVVLSCHWGGNWGHYVHPGLRDFCHALIDAGDVDLVHGHSTHHVKPIEVYRGRLILYGCGDLMNDYSNDIDGGPRRAERLAKYRPWLELGYFADLDQDGALQSLAMTPFQLEGLILRHASSEDAAWMAATLTREGELLGTAVEQDPPGRSLLLRW